MIRVGKYKPRFRQRADRWNRLLPELYVDKWFWLEEDRFEKIQHYENPLPSFTHCTCWEVLGAVFVVQEQMKLCPNGFSTLWEFDAWSCNKKDRIRWFAEFGHPTICRWSWFDCFIIYPTLWLLCAFINLIWKKLEHRRRLRAGYNI